MPKLITMGREMLAMTEDGHLYYSTSEGAVWMRRR